MRAVIGSPASYAALNTVVETWQTPPPSPVSTSPLMITGASRKPFAAERSPVAWLNEKVAPGAISLRSTRCATSWTLWMRFGDAAVDRLVGPDGAGDPHRARGRRRALRLLHDHRELRDPVGSLLRGGEHERRRATARRPRRPARRARPGCRPLAVTAHVALRGPWPNSCCRCANSRSAAGPARRTLVWPSSGRASIDASCAARQRRCGRRRPTTTSGAETMRRAVGCRRLQRGDGHASADRREPAARPAGARSPRARGRSPGPPPSWSSTWPIAPGSTEMRRPRRTSRASRWTVATCLATRPSSYCEGCVVDVRRRNLVPPEDPEREPPVAAQRERNLLRGARPPRRPRASRRSRPARAA